MSMVGADSEQLLAGVARMRTAADELDSHAIELSRTLGSVSWLGQIANNFVNMWNSGHKRNLGTTAKFIREAADRLQVQANQQIEASGGVVGSSRLVPWTTQPFHVGHLPSDAFATAKSDWQLVKGGASAAAFALWMAKHARVLSNLQADTKHIFHYAPKAGKALTGFAAFGLAKSSYDLAKELRAHHYGTASRRAIDIVWKLGARIPIVDKMEHAYTGGFFVGRVLSHWQERVFHTQTHTVDWAVKTYGSTNIGSRYSGWSGFKHWAIDSVHVKN